MKMIITQGISASGKTTWAEKFIEATPNTVNINRDDIRFNTYCNGVRDWSLYRFTKERERNVSAIQEQAIAQAAKDNLNVIISDTNLNTKTLARLEQLAEEHDFEVYYEVFHIEPMVAIERDAKRANGVGYKVIMNQYKQFAEMFYSKDYHQYANSKRDAIVIDVDGTLADMRGVRTPFEWTKVKQDKPHKHVVDMVKAARLDGLDVVIMSGRDGSCLQDTQDWLEHHLGFSDFWLFMRATGDMRKDTVVKKELFKRYVDNNFNVQYVIDDRPSVCRMWQYELGLKVVQVGNVGQEF